MIRNPLLALIMGLASSMAGADTGTVESLCGEIGGRLRSVSTEQCLGLDFVVAQERTQQGRPLMYRDFEAVPADAQSPAAKRVLVIGGIHGDELTSVSIVFRWLGWIQNQGASAYHWRVVPVSNPDGLMARPPTRVNGNGVDINRNFQTPDWDKDAQEYWQRSTKRDPRRNPGPAAGSEIETRWLQAQIEEFRPDLVISIHAPYNLLDYDGPVPNPMRFGRLSLYRLGIYPGSMGNYCGVHKQIPTITLELPNATVMPSERDQKAMWDDMLKWMKQNILTTPR